MMECAKRHLVHDHPDADIVLSTAHQSKGCEFPIVIVHNDFIVSNMDECNVLYVALTRAKHKVYVNHKVLRVLKNAHGNIYYPAHHKTINQSKRCDRCKSIMTNQLIMRECDEDPLFNKECEIHIVEHICQSCKSLVLPSVL